MSKPTVLVGCSALGLCKPPVAEQVPHLVSCPNGDRIDEYYWLRDDNPQAKRPNIIEYLATENAYAESMFKRINSLYENLVAELRSRIADTDATAPVFEDGYWYWRRFASGAEYPAYLRQNGSSTGPDLEAPIETILDGAALASGLQYFNV